MTRTKPLSLVLLALLGSGIAWFTETALTVSGQAVLIPPVTLAAALALIGVIVVVMALPVRRVARGLPNARVDPFYATRVVVLAKASALGGALLAGVGLGISAYLLSRSVLPAVESLTMGFATAVGGVLLLAGGLIAEYMCAIPPDDKRPGDRRDDKRGPEPERIA